MKSENHKPVATSSGAPQWKSLEEAHADPATLESFAAREFGAAWEAADSGHARRDFLRVMGASMSLAGLGACVRQPDETIVPYVKQPEQVIPGKPRYYATSFERGGYATGVLGESHLGRPTHLEGNPEHPSSLGGLDPITQASVLTLWDPERSKAVVRRGKVGSWDLFAEEVLAKMSEIDGRRGAGFRILTPNLTSPSLTAEIQNLLKTLPEAKWHQYEPVHRDTVRRATEIAFGSAHEVRYAFDEASVVLTLDADVVTEPPGRVVYAKDLVGRRSRGQAGNRIYALESSPTSTGAIADHRWPARASDMGAFLGDVAAALGVAGASEGGSPLAEKAKLVAEDLSEAGARAVVVPGDHLSAEVHALALAVNEHLGALGKTVLVTEPVLAKSEDNRASIAALTEAMKAGEVDLLLVLDGNPIYDAPADLGFTEAFRDSVPVRVHASTYYDETARLSQWHLPLSHYLESWSDHRAHDGTLSIAQPLIAPIYDSRSAHEIVAIFAGILDKKNAELVQSYYQEAWGEAYESKWRKALHDGVVDGTAAKPISVKVSPRAARADFGASPEGLEVVLRPCPSVWDGRYANNAWLQETPRPISRVVWDNALYMSPATAEALGVKNDEVLRLTVGGNTIEGPAWVLPGTAKDSITVHLGYGRTEGGKVAEDVGFSAYPLLEASRVRTGASVESMKRSSSVVTVQDHFSLEGRNHVRHATKDAYASNQDFAQEPKLKVLPLNLYPKIEYEGRAWGMVIDLGACTGCNACMVACQSENNIPVVGKEQVGKGRELHWIRIDRYFEGDADDPTYYMQPLTCMHCERAPCEPVCPANATVHGPEGLNQMVYNRCIGTRYCSNNCPYKVRRFNFHLYADFETESLKGQRNPDVTVRSRGVMEKCTYCIQRIKAVKIEAVVEDWDKIPDGTIVTACESACPTNAIVFGDINDADSRVAKLKASPLDYTLLEEINTAPRTSYLAAVTNPNPKVRG